MAITYSEEDNAQVAELIRSMRSKRGLSQQNLSELASVSLFTIQKLERGTHVRLATMKVILEALGGEAKLSREAVERITTIYGLNIEALDQRLIAQGPEAQALDRVAVKDLHMLLDRAIGQAQQYPDAVQEGMMYAIQGMLASFAGETRPAPSTTTLAKRHPPEQVGNWEVELVEPATPTTKHKKSG